MLTALHRDFRRHRTHAVGFLALLAFTAAVASAHASLVADAMGDHGAGNVANVCVVLGATLAVTGAAVLTVSRISSMPLVSVPALAASPQAPLPAPASVLPRAGPPALLQVFRL